MEQNLSRQIKILQFCTLILTVTLIILAILFWRQTNATPHFKQIDAERINIVEKDGRLRLVISNQKSQHSGSIDGKEVPHRERSAGLIFFNDEGDECGGMVYDGNKDEAGMGYSIDQYKNDQIMQLQYNEGGSPKTRTYGLKMWDRPDDFTLGQLMHINDSLEALHDTAITRATFAKLDSAGRLGTQRLFLGKARNKDLGLFLRD